MLIKFHTTARRSAFPWPTRSGFPAHLKKNANGTGGSQCLVAGAENI
jgi:hypothetical protein